MKNIKKKLQKIFKAFFYKIFILFYGNIKGKTDAKKDSRIKVQIVKKENNIKYRIFNIKNSRLYTDRIQDTAIILDNFIVDGPSFQLRQINLAKNNAEVEQNIVFRKGTPRIKKKINGKVLSLLTGGAGNDNYWHWMFDVLPRLSLCEEVINLDKIDFFLLPEIKESFQKQTLDLLNIPKEKRLSSRFFRHIDCPEIIVTDHPYGITNDITHDIQNIPRWIQIWLKKKYMNENFISNPDLPKRIYIDRKDAKKHALSVRSLINEDEVKNFLLNKGFKSVVMKDLHFSEQVKLFNNAEFIIGLHGAAFANLCFCKPGTKVVELTSTTGGKMIENMALINDVIHKPISCVPREYEYNQSGHINVSVDLLEKVIKDLD